MQSTESSQQLATTATILDQGEFQFWKTTDKGIKFNADTPLDNWLGAVQQLCHFYESSSRLRARTLILLADALNFGEEHFGEQYAQAIDGARAALGLSPARISNAMSVLKKIPASRRREGLTLGHYDCIASLDQDDQDKLIAEAAKEDWSVSQLREVVAERFPTKRGGKKRSKAKAKETDMAPADALEQATVVLNWAKAHEEDLGGKWEGVLGDFFKLYRRVFQARKYRKK